MSDIVVDASVALKWFVTEADSVVADELSADTGFARHVTLLSDWRSD